VPRSVSHVLAQLRERWILTRLDRALPRFDTCDSYRPPIEQIARDLRRLRRNLGGVATRNRTWHEAVCQAYDDRLRLACRCLGVTQHLDGLDGLDLEIERIRVEGALRAAGLYLGQ
jgi:hypothetical protein